MFTKRSWGKRPERIFRAGIGKPHIRMHEKPISEALRQKRYAEATVREDGEHWTDGCKVSIEEEERQFERGMDKRDRAIRQINLKAVGSSIWHMGMYAPNPEMARLAIVHTAQEQLGVQREISAQQRLEDQRRDEERMAALAKAFFDEAERRGRV